MLALYPFFFNAVMYVGTLLLFRNVNRFGFCLQELCQSPKIHALDKFTTHK